MASLSPRLALFERSKLVVRATGPVAVFEASSARFGVGGARSSARRHGEVFLGARRRGQEAWGRVAKARSAARSQSGAVAMWPSARFGVGKGAVACGSNARPRGDVLSAHVGVGEDAEACSSISSGCPGALLGSSVAFGSGCGQALPGVPSKASLFLSKQRQ